MRHGRCEWLREDSAHYCEIPGLPGVWSNADTEKAARAELQEALEDWIALGLSLHQPLLATERLVIGDTGLQAPRRPNGVCYPAGQARRRTDISKRLTASPETRSKSVSVVMIVRVRSRAVAAISVSVSPISPGPLGGRRARRNAP